MKLCVLGSGSRGNAVLLQSGNTRLLVDAGFGPRMLARRLGSIGVDPASISAVFITHEHTDHVRGVSRCAARWSWEVYATAGTQQECRSLSSRGVRTITANSTVSVGDLEVTPLAISHDASEPVAFVATGSRTGARAAIVYDLGVVTPAIQKAIERVEILVIESNHDGEMLRTGPYPTSVKRRIASRHGHLSNRAAGHAAARCAHRGLAHVVLAHLSEINNTPRIAGENMKSALARTGFHGRITASAQDAPSRPATVTGSPGFTPVQLSLAL